MSFADNVRNVAGTMQSSAKNAGASIVQKILRLITGFFIGLVFALIVQEFTQNGTLMLVFLTILFMLIVYRLLRSLSIWQIIVFDVFCVLIANSLRMYIMMAP